MLCLQLNKSPLQPHKGRDDHVVKTALQLAPHTQLLLDETDMQQGQLTDVGCKNIIVSNAAVCKAPLRDVLESLLFLHTWAMLNEEQEACVLMVLRRAKLELMSYPTM